MNKPRIKIALDTSDWIMEIIGAMFLLLIISVPLYYFDELPDTIPIHFNLSGEADGFSQKDMLWTLPVICIVVYVGMLILSRYPHIFNYPTEITDENAQRQYRLATKLIRTLKTLIAAGFFYISFATIQTAMNMQDGLGNYFTAVFLLAIFGSIGIYMYQVFRKER